MIKIILTFVIFISTLTIIYNTVNRDINESNFLKIFSKNIIYKLEDKESFPLKNKEFFLMDITVINYNYDEIRNYFIQNKSSIPNIYHKDIEKILMISILKYKKILLIDYINSLQIVDRNFKLIRLINKNNKLYNYDLIIDIYVYKKYI